MGVPVSFNRDWLNGRGPIRKPAERPVARRTEGPEDWRRQLEALTEDQVAARLRVSKGRLRKLESLVSIAVDLGEAGLRWEPEAFEGWLVAQQGRGAAA